MLDHTEPDLALHVSIHYVHCTASKPTEVVLSLKQNKNVPIKQQKYLKTTTYNRLSHRTRSGNTTKVQSLQNEAIQCTT